MTQGEQSSSQLHAVIHALKIVAPLTELAIAGGLQTEAGRTGAGLTYKNHK